LAKKTAEPASAVNETLALTILQDRIFNVLLESGPRKTGELVAAVDHPAVNLHLAKYALRTSERFTQTQRKWDIAARWQIAETPFEQLLEGFLTGAGRPLTVDCLTNEMAVLLNRDTESMGRIVRKFLSDSAHFAEMEGDTFALASWVLDTDYDSAADILFYNFMDAGEVEPFRKAAGKVDWAADATGAAIQMVLESPKPVPFKALSFFAWESLGVDFDSAALYESVLADPEIVIASTQQVYREGAGRSLLDGLKKLGASIKDEFEDDEEEESAPPALTDADLEEIARIVEGRTETTLLSDVMLQIFEIEQGERAYEPTEQMLVEHLRHDPRFAWLGAGRFRPVGFVPENVLAVPEALVIPEYDFATIEGERFDLEMEVAGLESKLAKEVHALLVQDVGDEDEPERPAKHPDQASCVLMYHHKQQGTFPLAQIPEGLFSAEPPVQEIVLGDGDTQFSAWVNLSTRLVYGLGDFYTRHDMPISGGIFRIHATRHADRFDLEYSGETDETASVPPGRLLELLQLKEEADGERLPTYEVMCRMLERQTGGMSFPHIFVELNLIRRVRRMLVASILSGYPCFARNSKTGLWGFDDKKRGQAFTKSKRKYVVRES
jgi:hypothetical protein